jgi:hypothetical protein
VQVTGLGAGLPAGLAVAAAMGDPGQVITAAITRLQNLAPS